MHCFTIPAENIEGRLDPIYNRYVLVGKQLQAKYPLISISSLLKEKPQYGANQRAINGDPDTDIRYIRITDIDEFGNLRDDDWKTARKIEDKYLLEDNDILFARSGATAGKSFIYKKKYRKSIFAGYLIRFKIDENKINPLYVFHYTHLERYSLWVKSIQRPSGQPNINSEEFKSFEIPLPPSTIQDQIVKIIQDAYELKEEKEYQAIKMIESINPIFYKKLNVSLPNFNSKFPRVFTVNSDSITENRFDPNYYLPEYIEAIESIKKSKFRVIPFGDLIEDIANGIEIRNYVKDGTPYLRVSEMKPEGLDLSEVKYIAESQRDLPSKVHLETNDLLISRSGSMGLVDIVKDDEVKNSVISSHIIRIVLKNSDQLNPEYIMSYLRSSFGQLQFFRHKIGAVVPEIAQDAIREFLIIIPSIEIQTELANKMAERIQMAKRLRNEAIETIKNAYNRTEKMIS